MKATLQNVKRRYEQWRSARKNRREKIPEELLRLAGICALKYGKSITAKSLNLSSLNLKLAIENHLKNPPSVENQEIKLTNKKILDLEFFKAELKKEEFKIENASINMNLSPVLYELENKFGVRLRVFSESEHLQKRVFSAFSLEV